MIVWDKGPMGMGWHYRRSYETVLVATKKGAKCKWYDETNRVENIIREIPKIIPMAEEHPTVKPLKLMEHFINLHTKANDVVLDPFCGSGTTCIAAKSLERNYIGIELDKEYVNLSRRRLKTVQPYLIKSK